MPPAADVLVKQRGGTLRYTRLMGDPSARVVFSVSAALVRRHESDDKRKALPAAAPLRGERGESCRRATMPDEDEIQKWVEQFQDAPRRRARTAHRLRRLHLETAVVDAAVRKHAEQARGSFGDALKQITDSDVLAELWKQFDPTGVKREAWRRVHGSELATPFEVHGFELSEVARHSLLVWQKGDDDQLPDAAQVWLNSLPDPQQEQEAASATTPNGNAHSLSDHDRRVAKVERNFSAHGRGGKPEYIEFYDGKATPQQFSDWKRGDRRHAGKAWPLLEAAADDFPD
jgi:hypothetical protein